MLWARPYTPCQYRDFTKGRASAKVRNPGATALSAMTTFLQARIVAFSKILVGAFLFVLIFSNFWLPDVMVESDYTSVLYIAGHLARTGDLDDLYPDSNATSFSGARFDSAAHARLPDLDKETTAVFMYAPLVAWLFAPLSLFGPPISLSIWQLLSIGGLMASCYALRPPGHSGFARLLYLSCLYLPIFLSVWIGQVTILFGLLPLSVGYLMLRKQRPLLCGLIWSLLGLKPPFLFVAGFVALALAAARNLRCLMGLATGILGLVALSIGTASPSVSAAWLRTLAMGDAILQDDLYSIPNHLIASLPMSLLALAPSDAHYWYKIPIYGGALCLVMASLWLCRRIALSDVEAETRDSVILVIALSLLPLISPHMLYYDLALLLPAGVLVLGGTAVRSVYPPAVRRWIILVWAGISSYGLVLLFGGSIGIVEPSVLMLLVLALLVALWALLLRDGQRVMLSELLRPNSFSGRREP